jgi:hypothetical protein
LTLSKRLRDAINDDGEEYDPESRQESVTGLNPSQSSIYIFT